ncbi:MAG: O-antigen ligase family protein [Candidatus Andersenbacteria bacterium]|nr:O-antigen ligase family protein [Candidatus Andersenbacteria bacterium]
MASIWLFLLPALLLLGLLGQARYSAALVLLSALLPAYVLRLTVVGVPTNALELAIITVTLTGVIQPAVRRRWRYALARLPRLPALLIALLLFAVLASALLSPHPRPSWGIVKGWVVVPLIFGWQVFAATFRPRTRRRVTAALLASSVAMALLGLSQVIAVPRGRGIYDVPNSLAIFLTPLTVIAWWQTKRLVALILAAGLLATQSASALAAVLVTLALGFAVWPQRLTRSALASLVILAVLAASYLAATGRIAYFIRPWFSQNHSSITVRLQLWSIAIALVREHPLRGLGLGVFEPAYQQKLHDRFARYNSGRQPAKPLAEFVFRDPHNWVLSFWLNTGLLGLASFAGLNFWLLRCAMRRARDHLSQALTLALISLLIIGLADTIYWKNDLAALHWLLLALLLHQGRANRVENKPGQYCNNDSENS